MTVSVSKSIIDDTCLKPKYWSNGTYVHIFNGEIRQTNQKLSHGPYASLKIKKPNEIKIKKKKRH